MSPITDYVINEETLKNLPAIEEGVIQEETFSSTWTKLEDSHGTAGLVLEKPSVATFYPSVVSSLSVVSPIEIQPPPRIRVGQYEDNKADVYKGLIGSTIDLTWPGKQLLTCASEPKNFSRIEDCLSATTQNPCAEILDEIGHRLIELSEAALEEEFEGQLPLSTVSFFGLVNFLNQIVNTDLNFPPSDLIPGLVLTYGGNIRAEWQPSLDEILALEFIDSSRLKFVFFYRDIYTPSRVLRTSGSGSVLGFFHDHPRALKFLQRDSDG